MSLKRSILLSAVLAAIAVACSIFGDVFFEGKIRDGAKYSFYLLVLPAFIISWGTFDRLRSRDAVLRATVTLATGGAVAVITLLLVYAAYAVRIEMGLPI